MVSKIFEEFHIGPVLHGVVVGYRVIRLVPELYCYLEISVGIKILIHQVLSEELRLVVVPLEEG